MIKQDRGITVITLSIAVIIILIVTGMLVYSAKDSIYVKNLTNMQNDISNLRDKISLYYSQYGALPASTQYTNTSMLSRFPLGANDDLNGFLIIDLQVLDGLTLSYGKDYEKYKNNHDIDQSELVDIYVINEKSHNIFYVQGVGVNENGTTKMYYTDYTDGDKEAVNIVEIETEVRPGLEIGDYVNYTYDSASTYYLSQNTSGYTDGDVEITQVEGMKWRILNIHEDGTVDLISETSTYWGPHFGGYLGYNNGVYFDANNPATVTNAIPADSWTMVTLTINNAGFAIYVDGQLKYDQDNVEAWASDPAEASSDYDYGLAMNTIKSSTNFYLNHGAFWNLVETKVSDLIIYDRVLSATEVSELKELTSK